MNQNSKIRDTSANQAALPLSRQSQCSSLLLPHETIREGETLHWYLNLQNYDHKNKALDL